MRELTGLKDSKLNQTSLQNKVTIDCHKCEYYYVTWDKDFPHGCRVMHFKSRQYPSQVVHSSTLGMYCLSFKKKDTAITTP